MKKLARSAKRLARGGNPATLAIDVGGTGIKAMVLDRRGKPLSDRVRIPTPKRATPKAVIAVIRKLAKQTGPFDRVAVGFPGVVKNGVVYSAPNLGKEWDGFGLEAELSRRLERPVRVANDADVQGLGCITGRGIEMVITLGTGFGSVLFADGRPIHLELAHHPFHKGKTYEDELGHRALAKKGRKNWNQLLREAIRDLKQTFNYDRLYIGGGNAKFINRKLPAGATIVSNTQGLLGGIALWRDEKGAAKVGASRRKTKAAQPKATLAQAATLQMVPTTAIRPSITPLKTAPIRPSRTGDVSPVKPAASAIGA